MLCCCLRCFESARLLGTLLRHLYATALLNVLYRRESPLQWSGNSKKIVAFFFINDKNKPQCGWKPKHSLHLSWEDGSVGNVLAIQA